MYVKTRKLTYIMSLKALINHNSVQNFHLMKDLAKKNSKMLAC
jgi:hypothetical protein